MRRAMPHLLAMLLATGGLFALGAVQKAPCATERFAITGRGVTYPCYSDLSVLYRFEQLEGGRIPFLQECQPAERPCDEYPVGTMLLMWGAAGTGGQLAGYAGFYWTNVVVLLACALVATWALERMRARTILFAAAPVLAIYGTLNWDLFAVASATVATLLLVRGRAIASGVGLGIGAVAKVYPMLLVLPFGLHEAHEDRRRQAVRLAMAAAGTWAIINIPFAVEGGPEWSGFIDFNRRRGADLESMWTALCQLRICLSAGVLNVLVPIAVAASVWGVWRWVTMRDPGVPRWMMTFPMLVLVIVLGKFWSPQFALWLLPWFALSRIPVHAWLTYQASEVLEYLIRSRFMSSSPVPLSLLSVAVTLRAAVLLWCLWLWMRDPRPAPAVGVAPEERATMTVAH
jgi:hypothetical protein